MGKSGPKRQKTTSAKGVQKKKSNATSSKRQKLKYEAVRSQLDQSVDPLFGIERNPQGTQNLTPEVLKTVKNWENNFAEKKSTVKDNSKPQSNDQSVDDEFLNQLQSM
jgi:succinate dehydrogenase/fumarate reductase flavoprotein subunit